MSSTRRVQILERAFEIMEAAILEDLAKTEEETRKRIHEDLEMQNLFAEDKKEEEAITEAYRKLDNLSFEEIKELHEILKENREKEDEEEDEDISELFKKFIAAREDDAFSYIDIDGSEKTFVMKARTSLQDGYYALLFPLHKLPEGEIPFSKYYKFVFGDEDLPDHFELVTDEKVLDKLNSIFTDW